MTQRVIWTPQPGPQTALIACPIFEVFFGGARGGGKTEGSVGDWLEHSTTYGEAANGVFFRRKFKQLEEVVARTKQLFPQIGGKYNEQSATWTMPGKARLKFRYLERDQDAEEYQGHNYTRVYVEEAPNFPSPRPINMLRATLRSSQGVPCGMRLTGNPGGPGHHWVKARYIDPDPRGWKVLREEFRLPDGSDAAMERIFIPSKIADNVLLMRNDPTYVMRLMQSGSEALVKAWLEGDWDVIDGAFFDCWREDLHVLPAGEWLPRLPAVATRFRAMDWGSARPFSVGWYIVSDGTWGLPDGALLRYREWYGSDGRPDVGLKMDAPDVAKGIRAMEAGEPIQYGVADPAIFARDGGPSIAEAMFMAGVVWRRGDNKRLPGWEQVRIRLVGEGEPRRPMLYLLDTCTEAIRTLPILQHDEMKPEDVDSEMEDHAGDEIRYACMSRPWATEQPGAPHAPPTGAVPIRIQDLVDRQRLKRLAREAEEA